MGRLQVRDRQDRFNRSGLELADPARVTSLRKPTTPFSLGIAVLGAALALGPAQAWAQNTPQLPDSWKLGCVQLRRILLLT